MLIDARQSDGRPGGVRIEQVVGSGRPIGSHSVDVSALVDLAELVYGNAPPVVLVTVTAERFDLGADLSSPVASALPRVVDAVVAVVGNLHTEAGAGTKVPSVWVGGPFAHRRAWPTIEVVATGTSDQRHRWGTPTGDPCPRLVHLDGRVEGTGECQDCGFCLLLAGLVDLPAPPDDGPADPG